MVVCNIATADDRTASCFQICSSKAVPHVSCAAFLMSLAATSTAISWCFVGVTLQSPGEIKLRVTSTQSAIGGYRVATVTVAVAGTDGACAPVSSYCEWQAEGCGACSMYSSCTHLSTSSMQGSCSAIKDRLLTRVSWQMSSTVVNKVELKAGVMCVGSCLLC